MKRGGLGRGLSALIPGANGDREHGLADVPVDAIVPNRRQPRRTFSEAELEGLATSIREVGILQPVVLRRRGPGSFELVAGERRVRAARMAGLATVPAVIRDGDDTESLREALIENIHRQDLGPLELGAAFQELLEELGSTQETLAERLGCSRAHVANTIRLLSLPADVQHLLAEGRIQAGHGRALLGLADAAAQSALGLRAAAEGLSVRQVEDVVRRFHDHAAAAARVAAVGRAAASDPAAREVEEVLSDHLGTRVTVRVGRGRGRIVVEFATREDLDRIVSEIVGAEARLAAG